MLLDLFLKHFGFLEHERRAVDTRDVFGGGEVVEVFGEGGELGFGELFFVFLGLDRLGLAELVEGLLELQVFHFQRSELLLSLIEVVQIFPHKEPPEYFLNNSGLMRKITQILLIKILELLFLELFPSIVRPKLGLDLDGGSFLAFELFSFEVHFEFGLNF